LQQQPVQPVDGHARNIQRVIASMLSPQERKAILPLPEQLNLLNTFKLEQNNAPTRDCRGPQ
jgi:hypothetical protein